MSSHRVSAAFSIAQRRALASPWSGSERRFNRRVAMGDPQAPVSTVFTILDHHGLLGPDGLLQPDTQLVSMGDHFDWGKPSERTISAQSADLLLNWLLAHPPDQVILIAGNHDLARVGELAPFDDDRFRAAQALADQLYDRTTGRTDEVGERELMARFPAVPSAEMIARDFATFQERQRQRVEALLSRRVLRLAYAAGPDLLLCHAGVTTEDLEAAGLPAHHHRDAYEVAESLNRALYSNAYPDRQGKLIIPALHRPGDGEFGEGRGILYHRPGHPAYGDRALFQRPWARRFDPRRLPLGLKQAIGHIRDSKCRQLLRDWAANELPMDGPLRHLQTDAARVRYARGVPTSYSHQLATMFFLDGGMLQVAPERYELLDLDTLQPAQRPTR